MKQNINSRNTIQGLALNGLMALATSAILLAPLQAGATVIGFEELGNVGTSGPTITNQYAGVVFSSTAGNSNIVSSQSGIGDGLNFLCTGNPTINCSGETILNFTSAVNGLTFLQVGDNNQAGSVVALVDVFVNNILAATVNVFSDGLFNNPNLVDLSAFNNVTSIRIYNITDGGGLGWDDFTFNQSTVPEPSSLALLGLGFAGLASLRHRKI